jgi:predicted small integral membrane protein
MPDWLSSMWDDLSTKLAWMAWTWPTAIIFGFVAVMLVILTLLAIYKPETPRKGLLGFPTTRGDRFFVSMIGSAFIFILWLRFGGGALWYPLGISVLFGIAMFRFA